jgi:heterodisulfide reductase subunit D
MRSPRSATATAASRTSSSCPERHGWRVKAQAAKVDAGERDGSEMSDLTFEAALTGRAEDMAAACTRCGKCVEACPSVAPAGIADAAPVDIISGVLDILRTGNGPWPARTWAEACTFSGDCIRACEYGVNPRFLLVMTRMAMAKTKGLPVVRRQGVDAFRKLSRDVDILPRLQLPAETLARLGQGEVGSAADAPDAPPPDFIFYTGCNVLKTPHIALLALDIMDALGVSYRVMGGPSHCCGIVHMRAGDAKVSGRVASGTIEKFAAAKSGQVLAWCPSCYVQFTEMSLPTRDRQGEPRPFEMTPFMRFLAGRLDELRPLLRRRVEKRVALHRHSGVPGVMEAAETLLRAVPGVEFVDLQQPSPGLQSVYMATLPAYRRELHALELAAAEAAKVDALAAVYHSDHRELCAHERDWPFQIVNVLEILGESMGLHQDDAYKRLKLMQDAEAIVTDCRDLIERHGLDAAEVQNIVKGMLADQPLPLAGTRP